MNILYHLTILPPAMPGCEAVTQEISALRSHFGGTLVYVNPNDRSPIYVPRLGFGLHKLWAIRRMESDAQIHHFFNPDPFPFPFLRLLRRPIVYSLTGGVATKRPNLRFLSSLAAVTVADRRSLRRLQGWGLTNVSLVRPGIDTTRFSWSSLPLQSRIRLLVGSAPWTRMQFRTKGIDALLRTAQIDPRLELVFLWRGVLVDELERRIRQAGLEGRVQILNERVDVNQVLARVHASIGLATDPAVVRPYPHSLIESLCAGKPILVSRSIPMADYVEQHGGGIIIESVTPEGVLVAVEALADKYDEMGQAARRTAGGDFAQQALITSYQQVYERVLEPSPQMRGS